MFPILDLDEAIFTGVLREDRLLYLPIYENHAVIELQQGLRGLRARFSLRVYHCGNRCDLALNGHHDDLSESIRDQR